MCKQCDDSLVAGATAANLLSKAAQTLYSMNDQKNSKILADAAGSLFTEAKPESKVSGDAGTASSADVIDSETLKNINSTMPPGLKARADGVLYMGDVAVGQVVLMKRPTKH